MELEITKDLHKKVSRTLQHTLIMQCIFQYLFYLGMNDRPSPVEILENITKKPVQLCEPFIRTTFSSAIKNMPEAVENISKHLVDWDFNRLSLVDQAILVLGYTEIYYCQVPKVVAINICVKMAQKFSSDDSYRYINGVLDKLESPKLNDEK